MSLPVYIILAFIIILVELKRKKIYKFDFLFFINGYFFLVYAFVPIIMLMGNTKELVDSKLLGAINYFGNLETPFILLISYSLIIFGYYIKISKFSSNYLVKLKLSPLSIVKLNYFGIIIIIISIVIYVNSFGGYLETIANAELIRNRVIEPPRFAFVKTFWNLSPFILLFSYYKVFFTSDKEKKHYKLLLLLSFVIFLFMIPVNSGRGFILFTILNLYLLSVILAGKYYFKYVIIFSFLGYIITTFGDSAFYAMPFLINEGIDSFFIALNNNINQLEHNSLNFFQVLCKNASHPIISLELSLNKSGYDVGFRYFFDSFFAIISVLPESLLNIELPKNISYLNTWLIWERERAVIPPGLIGYFSYSLGIIGILIGSFLYGLVAGIIQRFFYSNNYPVIMFFIAFGYGSTIFNGDPLIFVSANLLLIIVLFVFLLNSKIIRLRIKNV